MNKRTKLKHACGATLDVVFAIWAGRQNLHPVEVWRDWRFYYEVRGPDWLNVVMGHRP